MFITVSTFLEVVRYCSNLSRKRFVLESWIMSVVRPCLVATVVILIKYCIHPESKTIYVTNMWSMRKYNCITAYSLIFSQTFLFSCFWILSYSHLQLLLPHFAIANLSDKIQDFAHSIYPQSLQRYMWLIKWHTMLLLHPGNHRLHRSLPDLGHTACGSCAQSDLKVLSTGE